MALFIAIITTPFMLWLTGKGVPKWAALGLILLVLAGFILTIIGACYRWSNWGMMCSGDLLEDSTKKDFLPSLYMFRSGFLMQFIVIWNFVLMGIGCL